MEAALSTQDRRLATAGAVLLLLTALTTVAAERPTEETEAAGEVSLRLELKPLPTGARRVWLESDGDGRHLYIVKMIDGSELRLRPDEFAARMERDHGDRSFLYRLLNITSPIGFAWVTFGLLGQMMFTGRMLVQWLVSERSRRSVVPVGFWWLSLTGATMLLTYFVWRRDIVGVLGQSAGWIVYGRNLWLIYREQRAASDLTTATGDS